MRDPQKALIRRIVAVARLTSARARRNLLRQERASRPPSREEFQERGRMCVTYASKLRLDRRTERNYYRVLFALFIRVAQNGSVGKDKNRANGMQDKATRTTTKERGRPVKTHSADTTEGDPLTACF